MLSEHDKDGLYFMDLCRKGELMEVKNYLDKGFDPNSYLNYESWSPLFIAVKYNQIATVKLLIEWNALIDNRTFNFDVNML